MYLIESYIAFVHLIYGCDCYLLEDRGQKLFLFISSIPNTCHLPGMQYIFMKEKMVQKKERRKGGREGE